MGSRNQISPGEPPNALRYGTLGTSVSVHLSTHEKHGRGRGRGRGRDLVLWIAHACLAGVAGWNQSSNQRHNGSGGGVKGGGSSQPKIAL